MQYDRDFFDASGLRTFVPPNAFDVHAHLYPGTDAAEVVPRELEDNVGNVGLTSYRRALDSWMGDRAPVDGLFFPYPKAGIDRSAANQFLCDELARRRSSLGLMLIGMDDQPAVVEDAVLHHDWLGFKVYHVYAARQKTNDAEIGEFLPAWAWEIANRHELVIMLHMVRPRALADPLNQQYIRQHCLQFPHTRLILAHAARGFCGRHTVEGVSSLRGLDNVFFDSSVICEAEPLQAILQEFGSSRLMFGSDFPVSEIPGRCVSIGDSFLWLYRDNVAWEKSPGSLQPHRIGIESLLALRQACCLSHVSDSEVEQIFGGNARGLLKVSQRSSDVPTGDEYPNRDLHPSLGQVRVMPFDADQSSLLPKSQQLYRRAKQLIPGGTQLLSKRPEMFAPDQWPAYYRSARGCNVVDLDGKSYLDMSLMGIGACLLGYADPDVTAAVVRRVQDGAMCTLNSPEEVALAEVLVDLHPWADNVRYARTGGEAMAVAVRIARVATGRDIVAVCGYHGWHDWYLAANLAVGKTTDQLKGHLLPGLSPTGVPSQLAGTTLTFSYNNIDQLADIVRRHDGHLAAVVMEPTRADNPQPGFLEGVRELCDSSGAVLILDEITAGWRFILGGAHLRYGLEPDIAIFAKTLGNGHPMAAILGRSRIMQAAQDSFISSTYWTEGVGPTAALATIKKMCSVDVPAHVQTIGSSFREGLQQLGVKYHLPLKISGHPALTSIAFDHSDAAALQTLFTVRMLRRGILASGSFYPSLAHQLGHVETYLAAAEAVFPEIAQAVSAGDVATRIGGFVKHSGFARLA